MTLDLGRVRAETPGATDLIHLNNAGAALMPVAVISAVKAQLDLEAKVGGYEAAAMQADRIAGVYESVAGMIGANSSEIALTENATAAWQRAFYALEFAPGDRILTAQAEYAANYVAYLQVARRYGAVVEVIPNDPTGALDAAALERMIDPRVKLISFSWIPTNCGLVNPAAEVGRVARAHGITYLLDACQAVGQMPVDVAELGCDMLCATGRKFLRGPRGTGFLYVRGPMLEQLEPAMLDHYGAPWTSPDTYRLRPDARRFETWESSPALRLGLGEAVDYAMALGLDAIQRRCGALADGLRARLRDIPGVKLHDLGRRPCAIVSFSIDGVDSAVVTDKLGAQRINLSVSRPSSTLLDATSRSLPPMVRASPHYYNTETEIDRAAAAIGACASK